MEIKQRSAPQRQLWAQFDALQMGSGWDEEDIQKPVSYTHLDVYKRQIGYFG